MNHDKCHITNDFKFAGQNLAIFSRTGTFEAPSPIISKAVRGWYKEVQYAVPADLDKCCGSVSGKSIGHFTVMVDDRSTHVGCAIATYTDGKWKTNLVACNYSYTNMNGAKVYQTGKMASNCTTGVNPQYKALCSVKELIKS